MLKVDSRRTIWMVTARFMRANRSRNLMAVLAVVLTTVMFTSLFTAMSSVMKSMENQTIRMYGDSSHLTVIGLEGESLEKLRQDPDVEKSGVSVNLGIIENYELAGGQTDLCYVDENGAEAMNCRLTKGRLPVSKKEAAMSTLTLDALGIPHELGRTVKLTYTAGEQTHTTAFVLCGFWEGDVLALNQHVFVSEDFASSMKLKGEYSLHLWMDSIFELSEKAADMAESYGLVDDRDIYINSAYDYFSEDAMRLDLLAVIAAVIFGAGYLIIYNVFRISVGSDIRTYGLLRNIGMTGKQLKSLVSGQALILAVEGLPLGLTAGYFVGKAMTPYLLQAQAGASVETVCYVHPLVFAAAAAFSMVTVYLGCRLPCRVVSKLSPVEAVKMQMDSGSGSRTQKATRKISPIFMAGGNLKRSWKKTVLVVLSLALPLVLLNSSYSISKSYDYSRFLEVYASFDFNVSGLNSQRSTSYIDAVTPDFVQAAEKRGEVERIALLYNQDVVRKLDDRGYQNLENILDNAADAGYLTENQLAAEREYLYGGRVKSHVMGINRAAFEKMQFYGSAPSYEEFAKGDYVIVSDTARGFGYFYVPGESVTIDLGKGSEKTYEVLEIAYMPYDLTYRFGIIETAFDCTYYLPVSEYHRLGGSENAMLAGIDVKDGEEELFYQWLSGYIQKAPRKLYVDSRMELLSEYRVFSEKYYVITALLSAVLFIIGMLNFFNTSSVDIISRRRELSLLSAVGMTGGQIKTMVITEGIFYGAAAVLLADTLGMALAGPVIEDTVGAAFYFTYAPSIAPSLVSLPVMVLLAAAVPLYHYRRMQRQPIRERLAEE